MFSQTKQKLNHTDIENKFLECDLKVSLNSTNGAEENISIKEIIARAKEAGKALIITFTPGPFKPEDELPMGWLNNKLAMGCTTQLNHFESALEAEQLNAIVININKHDAVYQAGNQGLLAKKNLRNLWMISDKDNILEQTFGLATIKVNNQSYFERFTLVVTPDGRVKAFDLASPVNDVAAANHIEEINQFIVPKLERQNSCVIVW
ncbi:MAG: hypothetical protein H0W64_00615 [Gammaproteobacteria bacterium]|nr:hypothetical protein [Gammaproteobacteria bacterium]